MNAPLTRRALLSASTVAMGAVVLPSAAALAGAVTDQDADLFVLLDAWSTARAVAAAAGSRSESLWDAFADQEPERPEALHVRPGDALGCGSTWEKRADGRRVEFYDPQAVDLLRQRPLPICDEWQGEPDGGQGGRWVQAPDHGRVARRAEILAAHDAWWAERESLQAQLGLPAAESVEETACEALYEVERAILSTVPATAAGLVAKARWASWDRVSKPTAAIWSARIVADVVAMAERGGVAT